VLTIIALKKLVQLVYKVNKCLSTLTPLPYSKNFFWGRHLLLVGHPLSLFFLPSPTYQTRLFLIMWNIDTNTFQVFDPPCHDLVFHQTHFLTFLIMSNIDTTLPNITPSMTFSAFAKKKKFLSPHPSNFFMNVHPFMYFSFPKK